LQSEIRNTEIEKYERRKSERRKSERGKSRFVVEAIIILQKIVEEKTNQKLSAKIAKKRDILQGYALKSDRRI